jgi:hypothetical protein
MVSAMNRAFVRETGLRGRDHTHEDLLNAVDAAAGYMKGFGYVLEGSPAPWKGEGAVFSRKRGLATPVAP